MLQITEAQRHQIEQLAQKYQVARLELFGSGASFAFDPCHSDVDLLVEYLPEADLGPWLKHFSSLKQDLEGVFQRRVDLIEAQPFRNEWFRKALEEEPRVVLYAA